MCQSLTPLSCLYLPPSPHPGVAPKGTRLWNPTYRQTNPMKLSIALATCNGQHFLRDQLNSFLSQTRRPDELVVCDDRSDDQTPGILTEFCELAPFPVRILQNEHRLGIIKNFEQAVGLCGGDVIFLSDQDDSWAPEKLARHEAVYLSQSDVGLVFSNGEGVDEALAPLGYTLYDAFHVHPRRQLRDECRTCLRSVGEMLPGHRLYVVVPRGLSRHPLTPVGTLSP